MLFSLSRDYANVARDEPLRHLFKIEATRKGSEETTGAA